MERRKCNCGMNVDFTEFDSLATTADLKSLANIEIDIEDLEKNYQHKPSNQRVGLRV